MAMSYTATYFDMNCPPHGKQRSGSPAAAAVSHLSSKPNAAGLNLNPAASFWPGGASLLQSSQTTSPFIRRSPSFTSSPQALSQNSNVMTNRTTSASTLGSRTRQTRIVDHLTAVKAGSSSSSKPVAVSMTVPSHSHSTIEPETSRISTRRSTARSTRTSPEPLEAQSPAQPERSTAATTATTTISKRKGDSSRRISNAPLLDSSSRSNHYKHTIESIIEASTSSPSNTVSDVEMHDHRPQNSVKVSRPRRSTSRRSSVVDSSDMPTQDPDQARVAVTKRPRGRPPKQRQLDSPSPSKPLQIAVDNTSTGSRTSIIFRNLESASSPSKTSSSLESHNRRLSASAGAGGLISPALPSAASSSSTILPPPSTPPSRDGSLTMYSKDPTIPSTPAQQQQARLLAFTNPSFIATDSSASTSTSTSAPFIPPLMAPIPGVGEVPVTRLSTADSNMVAAHIEGMGRVAISRSTLIEHFGLASAERAMAIAATTSSLTKTANSAPLVDDVLPPLEFGKAASFSTLAAPINFDAFQSSRRRTNASSTSKPRRGGGKTGAYKVDRRVAQVKAWLDSDEEDHEVEATTWATIPASKAGEWKVEEQGVDLDTLMSKRLEPDVEVEDVVESEAEEDVDNELEQPRIRVGGKNITTLLMSKKRRVEEDEDELDAPADDEASNEDDGPTKQRSVKSKGKRRAVEAVCGCEEEEHDRLCTHRPFNASAIFEQAPKTPTLSHSEPILVSSSSSPRIHTNHFFGSGPDIALALAPSPQGSPHASPMPRRRVISRSPASSAASIPVTPKSSQPRADYAPRSPLFYRSARARLASGQFDEAHPGAQPAVTGGWYGSWDNHNFGYEDPNAFPAISFGSSDDGEWHDPTMTPSRAMIGSSGSSFSWAETMLSPSASGRRSRVPSGIPLIGSTTASQDFLSALHHTGHERVASNGGFSATAASQVAQRLFGATSPTLQHQPISTFAGTSPGYHSSPSQQSALHQRMPSTPLRVRSTSHRRIPSTSWAFESPSSAAVPSKLHPSAHLGSHARSFMSTPMQSSSSAPVLPTTPQNGSTGMARSNSGLGIGGFEFETSQSLDDLLMN